MLAREVAKLITASAIEEGDRLFEAGDDPPDGDGLGERITRAQWERRQKQKQIEWERDTTPNEDDAAATAAAFAALRGIPA